MGVSPLLKMEKQKEMECQRRWREHCYIRYSPQRQERDVLFYIKLLVARIKIVKEQKANAVEEMIVKMAQSGQIRDKVSEKQLIDLLEQLTDKSTKITILSKRFDDDDFWNLKYDRSCFFV